MYIDIVFFLKKATSLISADWETAWPLVED